jgi:hypothetical protein
MAFVDLSVIALSVINKHINAVNEDGVLNADLFQIG